jgi:hypothetical protein
MMVHPDSHRVSRVPWYSGILLELVRVSHTGLSPSMAGLSRPFRYPFESHVGGPTTPEGISSRRFRLFPVRSPLLGESRLISLPPGTEMFQFPGFASATYGFSHG